MTRTRPSRKSRKGVVFLIDSQPDTFGALGPLLGRYDLEARTFASAELFLAALGKSSKGVVVASIQLPGMDGLTLLKRLVATGHRLPVILLANNSDVPMAVRALRSGAFDFFQKPIAPRLLLWRVQQALGGEPRARTA